MFNPKNRKGLTLIQLMIVVVIIGILAVLVVSLIPNSIPESKIVENTVGILQSSLRILSPH